VIQQEKMKEKMMEKKIRQTKEKGQVLRDSGSRTQQTQRSPSAQRI